MKNPVKYLKFVILAINLKAFDDRRNILCLILFITHKRNCKQKFLCITQGKRM